MTTSIALGRAAACLERFAIGLCLAVVASAFFHAADTQISALTAPPVAVTAEV
jgi:hypothetical protein